MLPTQTDLPPAQPWRIRIIRALIILAATAALALALLGSPWLSEFFIPDEPSDHSQAFAQQSSATASLSPATSTQTLAPTQTATPFAPRPLEAGGANTLDGLMILSLSEGGYSQLFSHQLIGEPFTRLTSGAWDDVQPAISPDGQRVAFASNRGGAWDLYLLDLLTGSTAQLTDDDEYDGRPSWSPDGAWLAYEHTEEGDLEIYMQLIDGSIDPVRLSSNSGADYSPAWRPGAQQIAFVSDRGGSAQIWLVDLEAEGDARFQLLIDSDGAQNSPAWSPDGDWLAWSQRTDGDWTIFAQDVGEVDSAPRRIGLGEDPRLSLNGSVLLAKLRGVNENYLTAYTLSGGIALAPEALPGSLDGIAWGAGALPEQLPEPLASAALVTPNAIDFTAASNSVVDLSDVNAPFEQLSNAAAPAFDALRSRGAQLLGWDALSELSNAFVPLDQPLSPDRQRDWLYTGRAFELHSGLLNAGWMAIVREDFEGQTYWRIYLKAVADLGRPLTDLPWDLGARFSGTESNYQAGGGFEEALPGGGWLDFTALAADFGFERVPALGNWRSYYQGALFNEFAFRSALSWEEAMLELYSPEELATIAP